MISTGLFAKAAPKIAYNSRGLTFGGSWYFLGVQALAALVIILWTCMVTFVTLWVIQKSSFLRNSIILRFALNVTMLL